jgi:hypothetical protein
VVDVRRSHRRWFAYRLAILVPAFLSAVSVMLWVAVGPGAPSWLRVTTTTLALLVDMLLGYLLFQTALCAFFHAGLRLREARILRGLLSWSRTAAFASIGLLWALALVPELFREPAPAGAPAGDFRREPRPAAPDPRFASLPGGFAGTGAAHGSGPAGGAEAPELPARLELDETAFAPPPRPADPVGEAQDEGDAPDENPRYRPAPGEDLRLRLDLALSLGIDRPWLPDEGRPAEKLPVEVRLDLVTFSEEGREAAGLSLSFDLPLGRTDSVRTSYLVAFVEDDIEGLGGTETFRDEHVTVEYVKRLAGFTRRAPFDLALSVGFSLDRFSDWRPGEVAAESVARLSPHVGIELGLWQSGPMGLSLHAGQTIPVNLTGGSASVTELAAVLHVTVSEGVSLRLGYQVMVVHLRDYEGSLGGGRASDDLDRKLAGPMLGLEVRF